MHNGVLSNGSESHAEAVGPHLEIIENSLISFRPFVEGIWLNSMPPLSTYHALQVFQQVGSVLASIHERGWVHGMLEVDHILLDCTGQAHLMTPPLSWLDEIIREHSCEELPVGLYEDVLLTGGSSGAADVSGLLSLVYHLFADRAGIEYASDTSDLRRGLREGIPLQLEMVLAQFCDVSQRDSIHSVNELMELISGCFSPRLKRRGPRSTLLSEKETCDTVRNESLENPREESPLPRKKRGGLRSQSMLLIDCIKKILGERRVCFEGLVGLCAKWIAQWEPLLPFFTRLRAGLLSAAICSFIISVSLLVSQGIHQVAEPAKLNWQENTSDRSSDTKDKRKDYVLSEVPLPKFFEEYGGDEYGGFIE